MEHFTIIQALCREAMRAPTPALRKRLKRLASGGKDFQSGRNGSVKPHVQPDGLT